MTLLERGRERGGRGDPRDDQAFRDRARGHGGGDRLPVRRSRGPGTASSRDSGSRSSVATSVAGPCPRQSPGNGPPSRCASRCRAGTVMVERTVPAPIIVVAGLAVTAGRHRPAVIVVPRAVVEVTAVVDLDRDEAVEPGRRVAPVLLAQLRAPRLPRRVPPGIDRRPVGVLIRLGLIENRGQDRVILGRPRRPGASRARRRSHHSGCSGRSRSSVGHRAPGGGVRRRRVLPLDDDAPRARRNLDRLCSSWTSRANEPVSR